MNYFLATLTLVFGAVALWGARRVLGETRRTRDWPATPGRILERGVGEPLSHGRTFMPHVVYTYAVGGTEHSNDQVYVIRRTGNLRGAVQRLVDGLPDPVPVHYDPTDPSNAYLLVNPRATSWTLVAFGIGAIALGTAQLLVAAG